VIEITAPMGGKVIEIKVGLGDAVNEDDEVLILEAMKMENALPAPANGKIAVINYKSGDTVAKGDVLCLIE